MSQTEPVRYAPSLETERPEEAEITAAMLAVFAKIQETTFKDYGHAVRGVHAKAHGLLTGRFAVLPDLPAPLAQGLCAAGGS